MNKTCAFFGHSMFVKCRLDYKKFKDFVESLVLKNFSIFLVGTYGEFDEICLNVCLTLKEKYSHIRICKVFSSVSKQIKEHGINPTIEYISYEIEQLHFKQRITQTNRIMIDKADIVVCFIDKNITNSGALQSIKYAFKQNKNVINVFELCNKKEP